LKSYELNEIICKYELKDKTWSLWWGSTQTPGFVVQTVNVRVLPLAHAALRTIYCFPCVYGGTNLIRAHTAFDRLGYK
jgi:hypothetical protein